MACEYICDGCGKREAGKYWKTNPSAGFKKPEEWFERGDEEGIQVACSRGCIGRISEKSGKTRVVLPF